MQHRPYGRAGVQVSEIGLGGHQEGVEVGSGVAMSARYYRTDQERARIVGRAIDAGVTYFDTTYGCELASLGRVLQLLGKRDGLFVSAMRVDFFSLLEKEGVSVRAYTRREVEARLREFGFDAVDQFMLGAIDITDPVSTPDIVGEALDELGRLRDEGKLRFVGFSCHRPDYAARMLTAYPAFDAVMTPYNYANLVAEGALGDAVEATGAAWIAMKNMVWELYGLPVTALRRVAGIPPFEALDPTAPIAQLALRYVLANPHVTTCVPAMNSITQVEENVSASGAQPLTGAEPAQLDAYATAMKTGGGVPLAIAALSIDNLRVRRYALTLLAQELGLDPVDIDWAADNAEAAAAAAAVSVLHVAAQDDRWREVARSVATGPIERRRA